MPKTLGFDTVWLPDSQLLWRDVWATACTVAATTERVSIGIAVTNVTTRHPSVVASAIRTVQELAPDRLIVAFGAGDSALRPLGERPTPGERLRTGMEQVRTLLAGEAVDFGGGPMRLRDAAGLVPTYMAANGPKNLAVAGSIADGVIVLSGASAPALERSLDHVHRGAKAAGRDPSSIDVVVSAFTMVTDDVERDARLLKPICAGIAQTGGHRLLALADIAIEVPDRVPEVYPDLVHAEDWSAPSRCAAGGSATPTRWRSPRTFSMFGTVEEIAKRVQTLARLWRDPHAAAARRFLRPSIRPHGIGRYRPAPGGALTARGYACALDSAASSTAMSMSWSSWPPTSLRSPARTRISAPETS